jgi:hypothetical protein
MCLCLVKTQARFPLVRVAFLVGLTLMFSGWTTCNAIVDFNSCQASVPTPQVTSLLPGSIPGDSESVLLTVNGSGFAPESQILWNGHALTTSLKDSSHLETTITQQTFASFGGVAGGTVQISVRSPGSVGGMGCQNGLTSATLFLSIT